MNKSYLKWTGGKGRALKHILPIIDSFEFNTFVEPFVGAANVSLNVEADNYVWNDLNRDLMSSHFTVISDPLRYIYECQQLFDKGLDVYYDVRSEFNSLDKKDYFYNSVLFQYLNKHGFNGLCRYNKSGGYNVPIGIVSKKPKNVPVEQVILFVDKFQNKVKFFNTPFEDIFDHTNKLEDKVLIYCDPPYIPNTSNFKYTADGFSLEDQRKLVDKAKESRHNVLISNHWNGISKELYSDADEVWTFDVQRTVSGKGSDSNKVQECLVLYKGD